MQYIMHGFQWAAHAHVFCSSRRSDYIHKGDDIVQETSEILEDQLDKG